MFYHLRIILRNLCRNGVYSAINIIGLAVSLAACAFILLWIQDETGYDRFHHDADNIYTATAHFNAEGQTMSATVSSGLFAPTAKETFAGDVTDYCRLGRWGAGFLKNGDVRSSSVSCFYADANFFNFFNFPIVKGNSTTPLQNPMDVVINERLAMQLFGDSDPIGQTALIDGKREVHITAVMADMTHNSSIPKVDMVSTFGVIDTTSGQRYYLDILNTWKGCEFLSYMRIKPGRDVAAMAEQITAKQTTMQGIRSFALRPLTNMHLYTEDGEPAAIKMVRMFRWIAFVILIIACINYVNLITARASRRHREIGLRKIIGARKWGLFTQFTGEAAALFMAAVVVAMLLNVLLMPAYNALSGKEMTFNFLDGRIWLTYAGMLAAVVLLAGLYPAYILASYRTGNVLQQTRIKSGNHLFRRVLVVTQFAASTALIVGTIALAAQMRYIREKDMGYDRQQVFTLGLNNMRGHFAAVKAELEQQTSVAGVTAASENIMNIGSGHGFDDWEGKTTDGGMSIHTQLRADTSFLRAMRLQLVAGTNFTNTAGGQYILNEAAVKAMGLTDPVGKWVNNPEQKIVGVVKDFHFQDLHSAIDPLVIFYNPGAIDLMYVRAEAGHASEAVAAVEKIWKQYNPEVAFSYTFMDEYFDRIYRADIRTGQLFGVFAAIAVLISCLGLFGLVTFIAETRTKEIGIRKVLGASAGDMIRLLSGEFMLLVCISVLIAFPVAWWWVGTMLDDFAYRITPAWWMFAASAGIICMLTLLTAGWKAISAASTHPVKAIRTE
jgi:ABC-type lipoprotein release transport system permease subunit